MSQWTHFLGVVRYDSFVANVWPKPVNKESEMQRELELVNVHWQTAVPGGSEGPLEIKTLQTNRGATVLVTGDLRDFGKEDLGDVLAWCESCREGVANAAMGAMKVLFIRDAIIRCEVEYDDAYYLIRMNADGEKFIMDRIPEKEASDETV